MQTSVFFILLPAFHLAFAGIFFGVWRMEKLPAAGWAGICFAVGGLAIPLDLLREPPLSYGFLLAVPMHWAMVWFILNAYLARHGDVLPAKRVAWIIGCGLVGIAIATWPFGSSYIRISMVTLVAMAIVGMGALRLRQYSRTRLDRAVAALAMFSFFSYFARGIAYPIMQSGSDLARHPVFSAYWNMFYVIVALLGLVHGLVLTVLMTLDLNNRHHRNNARDILTGVGNRRALASLEPKDVGAVLMIDLDHFKRVNDVLGHAAGDAVLRLAAETIVDACPAGTVIRMGGEEFAVILPDGHEVDQMAEQVRAGIEAMVARHDGQVIRITASVGYARSDGTQDTASGAKHGAGVDQLLRYADRGLYAAKTGGRNRAMKGGGQADGVVPVAAAMSDRIAVP